MVRDVAEKGGETLGATLKGFGLYFKRSAKKRTLQQTTHGFTQIPQII